METFVDYCKDYIVDHIYDYEGQTHYACDLGFTLTEGPNVDGSLTYSTYKAKQYICEWWDDAADYSDHEKSNFGERSNPFENPEAFMVCMVIEGVNYILSRCKTIDDAWDDQIELTDEVIKKILEEVDEVDEIEF